MKRNQAMLEIVRTVRIIAQTVQTLALVVIAVVLLEPCTPADAPTPGGQAEL